MAVLKQTSPTASPSAPKPCPQITLPSARTNTPVAPRGAGVCLVSAIWSGTPGVGFDDVAKTCPLVAGAVSVNLLKPERGGYRAPFPVKSDIERPMIRERLKAAQIAAMKAGDKPRSEERRGGKECVSTCRYRWSPVN